jgi:(p)ppGpp synthase/HD superfamily hydrolase
MADLLEVAIGLACASHRGQVDKAGQPYILHPLRLMLCFETAAERIVAVLHDVVEDTGVTLEQLRGLGFDASIVAAIDALSRRAGESYDEFLGRIELDPLATRVKVQDLQHNLDVTRLPAMSDEDLPRIAKYHRALARLKARG